MSRRIFPTSLVVSFLLFLVLLSTQVFTAFALTATPSATSACPVVSGYVRLGSSSGPGLADVNVSGNFSAANDSTSTITDSNGFFVLSNFCGVPGQSLVIPVLQNYHFVPDQQIFTGSTMLFIANPGTPTPLPQPDLVITSVVTSPQGWTSGCATNLNMGVRVTVRNNGAWLTGAFRVRVENVGGGFTDQYLPDGLVPGQSATLWFTHTGVLTVTVDPVNNVYESNEANNTVSYTSITATPPALCPTPTRTVTPLISHTPTRTVSPTPSHITLVPQITRTRTPTLTATRTRTRTVSPTPSHITLVPQFTRTRTPTHTFTPTQSIGTCSPVSATITAPFTFDGAGTFCWQASSLGGFINSWNTTSVTLNGVNITNMWIASSSYPAKIGGFYYISYNSTVAWAHFETK